jgi:hypothetical protein
MTPEINAKIALWRQRARENTLTEAEMVEAIQILRNGRVSASIASEKSKAAKAPRVIPTAADMLSELDSLGD